MENKVDKTQGISSARWNSPNKFIWTSLILLLAFFAWAKSSQAANWYVDKDAIGGNNGSSWVNAWKSFADINWWDPWHSPPDFQGIKPGDTLFISGGPSGKTYYEELDIGIGGTSGQAMISIKPGSASPIPGGHDGLVTIDGGGVRSGIVAISLSFILIDGEKSNAINLRLQNLNHGADWGAGGVYINSGESGIIIRYIEVSKAANGIFISYANNNCTADGRTIIEHSYIHDIWYDGAIKVNGSCFSNCNDYGGVIIRNNTIQTNKDPGGAGDGPDGIQGTCGVSVYGNNFSSGLGTGFTSGQHPDMIQALGKYWKIYNNTFSECVDSCIDFGNDGDGGHAWIFNNIFQKVGWMGFRTYPSFTNTTSFTDLWFVNNTYVDGYNHSPMRFGWTRSGEASAMVSDVHIKNNIFYNSGAYPEVIYMEASSGFTQADWDIDYNLVRAGARGNTKLTVDGLNYVQPHGYTDLDPAFGSYTESSLLNDLHLSVSDEAAKDRGVVLPAQFSVDRDGHTRPQGCAWDIGAYEYVPGDDTTPPASPTGLRVN